MPCLTDELQLPHTQCRCFVCIISPLVIRIDQGISGNEVRSDLLPQFAQRVRTFTTALW